MFKVIEELHRSLVSTKTRAFKDRGINNLGGFFEHFPTFSNARKQLQAPILMPLIDLSLAIISAINAVRRVGEIAIHLATVDYSFALDSTAKFFKEVFATAYYTLAALTDTLSSTLALATRTLVTAGLGVAKITGDLLDCCNPASNLKLI